MKIIYQKLKTKLRPVLKLNDNVNIFNEIEKLCLKCLGMGVLEQIEQNKYIFNSVLIFQKPITFIVKGE